MRKSTSGFTIVELLIVVVVIAILAAISVVAYTGIQNRANDSAIQSDLRNIGQKVLEYQATEGKLPSYANFPSMQLNVSKNSYGHHFATGAGYNLAYCLDASAKAFAFVAASKSGNVYVFNGSSTKQGVGPLVTIATTCSNNGQSTPDSSTWFYKNGSWEPWVGE